MNIIYLLIYREEKKHIFYKKFLKICKKKKKFFDFHDIHSRAKIIQANKLKRQQKKREIFFSPF